MSPSTAALSYHEPGIVMILILASFLLLENAINYAFDRLLFCGLIGQIFIGMAWGTPGANWLSQDVQNAITQLGYLGLILIVYEGGLSTDWKTLKSHLFLSSLVAMIGISAPIALSFTLRGFMDITPVQAFAAGAALCSTSLGTTFTILSTSGLSQSRLGVVLSSAAMMDDIVGLVMSSIVANLGKSLDFDAITVVRPVLVSVAFAVVLPITCVCLVMPITKFVHRRWVTKKSCRLRKLAATEIACLTCHTLVLAALVTGASYAGTSNLFAAYLGGAASSWWDGSVKELRKPSPNSDDTKQTRCATDRAVVRRELDTSVSKVDVGPQGRSAEKHLSNSEKDKSLTSEPNDASPAKVDDAQTTSPPSNDGYESLEAVTLFAKHYQPALQRILKPFFFASIGFFIPIAQMFTGPVVWRGIVYAILMVFGKLLCGFCLIPQGSPIAAGRAILQASVPDVSTCWPLRIPTRERKGKPEGAEKQVSPRQDATASSGTASRQDRKSPTSLYPAALLGTAMVARGEIGFLISSVAESNGVFASTNHAQTSELFLVVTWAILLCTLFGPVGVGLLVKRVKRLQAAERRQEMGREDPLGMWGVVPGV